MTPGGIPVRLLVDAAPRSRGRRALPIVAVLVLALGLAAVALAGCGAASAPRPPAAVVNRVVEVRAPAPSGAVVRAALETPSRGRAPAPDPRASVPGLRALALAGPGAVALWLHAPRAGYGEPVRGATVAVGGLAPGAWRVGWIDDRTGEPLATARVEAGPAGAVLAVPPFARHVAALLARM